MEIRREIKITEEEIELNGLLVVPQATHGLILFAHGSGSGRFSPRNNYVAKVLQKAGLATLLLDLLETDEEDDRANIFDIHLLAERLLLAKKWLAHDSATAALEVGYFGASTGAGAALEAAAMDPENIFAIVSRGGRPDLAGEFLRSVRAPTLLIVGAKDAGVIELNEEAFQDLLCEKDLQIVPRATHLFEEPGTLEEVADLATAWFRRHLSAHAYRWSDKEKSNKDLHF